MHSFILFTFPQFPILQNPLLFLISHPLPLLLLLEILPRSQAFITIEHFSFSLQTMSLLPRRRDHSMLQTPSLSSPFASLLLISLSTSSRPPNPIPLPSPFPSSPPLEPTDLLSSSLPPLTSLSFVPTFSPPPPHKPSHPTPSPPLPPRWKRKKKTNYGELILIAKYPVPCLSWLRFFFWGGCWRVLRFRPFQRWLFSVLLM